MGKGDLIVALATAAGESALGVVRLSGPGVLRAAAGFLKPSSLAPRVATVALVHDEGRRVDQVVATFFPGPRSYTGEDLLELSAHGSPLILADLIELACKAGARPAEPGEFTLRAYLNGRLDLAQAEAVGHLIRARTRSAARAALQQLDGGLSRAVEECRRGVVSLLANVEAGLDHPEEDLPAFSPRSTLARVAAIRAGLARLAGTFRAGRLAFEGARVSIVGRPNVGKSSLLNALLGRERAIVSAEPGTTRDVVEEALDLGGVRAVLADTAGLRPGTLAGEIEREGMRRSRHSLRAADCALVVLDRSAEWSDDDARLLGEAAAEGRPVVVALNKSDLPPRLAPPAAAGAAVEVSALTGAGVERLRLALRERLAGGAFAAEGTPLVLSARHRRALDEADAALERAAARVDEGELAAVHLREALAGLGAIVGRADAEFGGPASEEVLREIFSRFCVGK